MNSEPHSETCRAHLHSDRRTIECAETIGGPANPACFGRAVVHDSSTRYRRGCGDGDRTILRRVWRGHRLGAEPQEARRGAETATRPSIPRGPRGIDSFSRRLLRPGCGGRESSSCRRPSPGPPRNAASAATVRTSRAGRTAALSSARPIRALDRRAHAWSFPVVP